MFQIFKQSQKQDSLKESENIATMPAARSRKIAVIDTETTGIYPNRDRVIEVVIVLADWDGNVEEKYVTLINPERDLGDTNVHGIKASDVWDAPKFFEVAVWHENLGGRRIRCLKLRLSEVRGCGV